MSPALERELWQRTKKQPTLVGETPRAVIADMVQRGDIASPKQAWATLRKWDAAGLYDYGVAEDLGWINEGAKMPARLELRADTAARGIYLCAGGGPSVDGEEHGYSDALSPQACAALGVEPECRNVEPCEGSADDVHLVDDSGVGYCMRRAAVEAARLTP